MPTELSRRTLIATGGLIGAMLAAGATISPANAAETWGYPFTSRIDPSRGWGGSYPEYTPNPGPHRGIDYPFGAGTPIYAVAQGTVIYAGWDTSQAWGWAGYHVELRHPSGWTSFYAHMSALTVRTGDQIGLHTQVGNVGRTGGDWGNHLHLELWSSSSRSNHLDPYPYIHNAPLAGSGTVPPVTPPIPPTHLEEDMFIADVRGNWFLVVPRGDGKPFGVILGGDSGAGTSGLPVLHFNWQGSVDALKQAVDGVFG